MTHSKWTVEKQIDLTSEPNFRQLTIQMLEKVIDDLQKYETIDLEGKGDEIISAIYHLPTILFFSVDVGEDRRFSTMKLRCYRDRREFLRERKKES